MNTRSQFFLEESDAKAAWIHWECAIVWRSSTYTSTFCMFCHFFHFYIRYVFLSCSSILLLLSYPLENILHAIVTANILDNKKRCCVFVYPLKHSYPSFFLSAIINTFKLSLSFFFSLYKALSRCLMDNRMIYVFI